jgi:hypothetical protein
MGRSLERWSSCQIHSDGKADKTLPCKVVVMLQSSQAKAILQSLLRGRSPSGEDVVDIIDHQSHIRTTVLRHTLLDWSEILPLWQDQLLPSHHSTMPGRHAIHNHRWPRLERSMHDMPRMSQGRWTLSTPPKLRYRNPQTRPKAKSTMSASRGKF